MSRNTAPRYSARNPGRARPPEHPPSVFSLMFPPDYREWFPRQGGTHTMPQPAEVITQWFESTPVVCHPYREPHPCLNNSIVPPRISATPSISRTRSISPGSALDHFVLPLRAWADSEPL